jgi:hypothetical protein
MNSNRRVISATCVTHGGAVGFTNLVVTRRGGDIELDPHATGSCVITLGESGAQMLFEALRDWLS